MGFPTFKKDPSATYTLPIGFAFLTSAHAHASTPEGNLARFMQPNLRLRGTRTDDQGLDIGRQTDRQIEVGKQRTRSNRGSGKVITPSRTDGRGNPPPPPGHQRSRGQARAQAGTAMTASDRKRGGKKGGGGGGECAPRARDI